jgi:hypothetical protein
MSTESKLDSSALEALAALGVDASVLEGGGDGARIVVVRASMEEAVSALGRGGRDQVVMTRLDVDTVRALDRWVDAGVAKSRSEAAALFVQEGLKLRSSELDELSGAIDALEAARKTLRSKAQAIMGSKGPGPAA